MTTQIVREETRFHYFMTYYFRLAARDILYEPMHNCFCPSVREPYFIFLLKIFVHSDINLNENILERLKNMSATYLSVK